MDAAAEQSFRAYFDELFSRAVLLAVRITGDRAVAEELAAEAFTRACMRWDRLVNETYRDAWLMRVVTNLAIDTTRRRRMRPGPAEPASAGDEAVVLRLALIEALRQLPRRQREAVCLRFLADFSERDTAAALGVSAGSIKHYVHGGIARLRVALSATDDHDVEVRLAAQRD